MEIIMKKIAIAIVLPILLGIFLLIIILDSTGNKSNVTSSAPCSHEWSDANCVSPEKCKLCGKTKGMLEPSAHSGVLECENCGIALTKWTLADYVDEFENPTGKKYITTQSTEGSYTTKTVAKASLTARLQIDADSIGFILLERGTAFVRTEEDALDFEIKILDSKDQKHLFKGTLQKNSNKIIVEDKAQDGLLKLLGENDSVKIHIAPQNDIYTSYLFTLETAKITDAYKIHIQAQ